MKMRFICLLLILLLPFAATAENESYTRVDPCLDGLITVRQGKKWGCLDTSGREILPCIYNQVNRHKGGLVSAQLDGKWGFFDHQGNQVLPFVYESINSNYFPFEDYSHVAVCLDGKYGLIDGEGQLIIPHVYDFLYVHDEYCILASIGDETLLMNYQGDVLFRLTENQSYYGVSDGLIHIGDDSADAAASIYYLDLQGNPVMPGRNDFVGIDEPFSFLFGHAPVQQDGLYGVIDKAGNLVIPYQYDWIRLSEYGPFCFVWEGDLVGLFTNEGTPILPCIYDGLGDCSEGLICATLDGRNYCIDLNGEIVFECDTFFHPFENGLAIISTSTGTGLIDRQGNYVLPREYRSIWRVTDGFFQVISDSGLHGLADSSGQIIIPCEYSVFEISYGEGIIALIQDGQLVILDRNLTQLN